MSDARAGRRRFAAAGAMVAAMLVVGCGGSAHHASPASSATSTAVSTTTTPTTTPSSPTAAQTVTTSAANVRLPATFTIGPSGKLTPPTVSAPASVAVQLTVTSADGKPHRVTLGGHHLTVPAGGRASVLITGLKAGPYAVRVDGSPRGTLVMGAQPGP